MPSTQLYALSERNRFPILFWNYCHMAQLKKFRGPTWKEVVQDWVDAGSTVAMSPRFDPAICDRDDMIELLDVCAENDLKVILWDDRCKYWSKNWEKGEDSFRGGVEEAIRDFGKHPALFGFHGGDEPNGDWIERAYRTSAILKEMAPGLSHFINLGPYSHGVNDWMGVRSYGEYLDEYCRTGNPDFICFDVYWQMLPEGRGLDNYFRCLKMFSDAAIRNNRPWWVTLIAVGHYEYRCPTEDDFRWQINTAAALGAKGIAYFFMYMRDLHDNYRVPPIDEHWERTETFGWVSRQNRTFLKFHGEIMSQLTFQKTWMIGEVYGGWPDDKTDSLLFRSAKARFPLIVSEFKDPRGRDYLCIVNNSQTDAGHAKVVLNGRPDVHHIEWGAGEVPARAYFDDDNPGEKNSMVGCWLAPGQMEVYRIDLNRDERLEGGSGEWPAYKAITLGD